VLIFPGALCLGSDGLGIKMLRLIHGRNYARKVRVSHRLSVIITGNGALV
jgi:hypothetical protein